MRDSYRLVYLSPFPMGRTPEGTWLVENKTWSGVSAYADKWPGRVIIASPGSAMPLDSRSTSLTEVANHDERVQVVEIPGFGDVQPQLRALRELRPDVILTLLHVQAAHLVPDLPLVFTAECDFEIRREQARVSSAGPADRARVLAGLIRREIAYRRMIPRALSLQCNGPAATRSYASLAREPISYMDHRLHRVDVEASARTEAWDGSRPLRLGFSGRWTAIKGPDLAVRSLPRIRQVFPDATLTFFGGGEMENELRAVAGPGVEFAGYLDFETEWKTAVREGVDIMVLPHLQGDPSCTYYESIGSGAPVVGFAHATLRPLAEDLKVAAVARRRTTDSLAEAVIDLASDLPRYRAMRAAGIELVRNESAEAVTIARVDHLVAAAARNRRTAAER